MRFDQQYTVEQARDLLWSTLMDVHKVAACMQGVEEMIVVDDDRYEGTLMVKMGPVRLRFSGEVMVVTRDADNWIGVLEANARDPKAGGGFKASLEMRLVELTAMQTELTITLDTTFLGRIGELGRPLIKKKINSMMDEFIAALNEQYVTA
jgi:carbon monoxide dehydrogenase subunit G